MSTLIRDIFKKPCNWFLNFLVNIYTNLILLLNSILNWIPTSPSLLEQSESNVLKFLKNKPNCYYVEIGKGWGSNSNKVWTLDLNVDKKNKEFSNHNFNKRKSLVNQNSSFNESLTPVVFLHGLTTGSAIWLLNLDEIFENGPRRVLTIDILGFGRSSKPKFECSTQVEWDLVYSIEKWRRAIGLDKKFILVGHEFGAYIGLSYAFHFPEFVSHVVLVDSWGIPSQQQALQSRTVSPYALPYWVKFLNKYVIRSSSPFGFLRLAGPYGYSMFESTRRDLLEKYNKILINENADLIIKYIYHVNVQPKRSGETAFKALSLPHGWAKYPIIHRVRDLSTDINLTFIFGSRSWVDRQPAFQVKYLLGDDRVSINVIQGAGHLVFADDPDQFNDLIIQICNLVDQNNSNIMTDNDTAEETVLS